MKEYRPVTFEDKVCPAHDSSGVKPSAVASAGVDGEGGVFTDGVGVVVVVALPGVVVVMEDEVAGEEEDLRADFAALAHPLAVQADGQVGPRRQDGGVELVRAVDDTTGDTPVVVVLEIKGGEGITMKGASSSLK